MIKYIENIHFIQKEGAADPLSAFGLFAHTAGKTPYFRAFGFV